MTDIYFIQKHYLQLIFQLFRCKTSRQRTSTSTQRRTLFRMFRIHSFVQIHTHRIMLCCRLIKYTFHRTMQTDRLSRMTCVKLKKLTLKRKKVELIIVL